MCAVHGQVAVVVVIFYIVDCAGGVLQKHFGSFSLKLPLVQFVTYHVQQYQMKICTSSIQTDKCFSWTANVKEPRTSEVIRNFTMSEVVPHTCLNLFLQCGHLDSHHVW